MAQDSALFLNWVVQFVPPTQERKIRDILKLASPQINFNFVKMAWEVQYHPSFLPPPTSELLFTDLMDLLCQPAGVALF